MNSAIFYLSIGVLAKILFDVARVAFNVFKEHSSFNMKMGSRSVKIDFGDLDDEGLTRRIVEELKK